MRSEDLLVVEVGFLLGGLLGCVAEVILDFEEAFGRVLAEPLKNLKVPTFTS